MDKLSSTLLLALKQLGNSKFQDWETVTEIANKYLSFEINATLLSDALLLAFKQILLQSNSDINTFNLLDLSLFCTNQDLSDQTLTLSLIEDLLDYTTIDDAQEIFDYIEFRFDLLTLVFVFDARI